MDPSQADRREGDLTDSKAEGFKGLTVYRRAFEPAMGVFELTTSSPREETRSLTDQVRRSSRSACACIEKACRKKHHRAHFAARLSDSDRENGTTIAGVDSAQARGYGEPAGDATLVERVGEIGRLPHDAMKNPEKHR